MFDDNGGGSQTERLDVGEVLLVVPAAPEYLRLVRLTAAGLASRMGFTFDEVEDLRIAVDECCHLLVGEDGAAPAAHDRTIELRYTAGTDSIGIAGWTATSGDTAAPTPNELSLQILNALVDEIDLTAGDGRAGFRLTKWREA
ncbi:MAG: ATP-binding protein [Acidimicrobiia bacterium]